MENKKFLPTPKGDVRVETPDGTSRTFGDVVRQSLDDANYIPEPGFGVRNNGWGAFPQEGDGARYWGEDAQPTMRKPVNE